MIYDKLKIYVSKEVDAIITKDAESFEFFKSGGKALNKNALLTRLIVNYFDEFYDKQNKFTDFLADKISREFGGDEYAVRALCQDLAAKAVSFGDDFAGVKVERSLSLKPTKASEGVITYITENCLAGVSLSEFFRNMLISYTSLPQDRRQKIIFREEYETLACAIKDKKQIFITLNGEKTLGFKVSPYALVPSKEELHLYLIGTSGKGCAPFRLSRIASIRILPDSAQFTDDQLQVLERMITYGPQFIYRPNEEEAIVRLTAAGKKRFRKLYVHRPVPYKIEGDDYHFLCSHSQLLYYFARFESDAYVVCPQSLRDDIIWFHKRAIRNASVDPFEKLKTTKKI